MNVHHLVYLDAVLRAGSFAGASHQLNVTPQAVGKAISSLEEELGYPLFNRHGRTVTPTENARIATSALHGAIDSLRAAETLLQHQSDLVIDQGDIALGIGAFTCRGTAQVPHFLESFAQQWPRVRVTVRELLNETCHYRLAAGNLDVAIVAGKPHEEGVVSHQVGNRPLMLAVAADHPLANCDAVKARELHDLPLAAPTDQRFLEPLITTALERARVVPSFVELPPSAEDHHAFLRQGGGIITFANTILAERGRRVVLKRFSRPLHLRAPLYVAYRHSELPTAAPLLVRHLLALQTWS